MTDSIKDYKVINTRKNAVAAMLKAQGIDPNLVSDINMETVAYHVSDVFVRMNKLETSEERERYLLAVIVMAFAGLLEPSILEGPDNE